MQQQQQVIIVSSLKTRFQREKTTIKVTFFRIDHHYVTFIGNVYNWRIFGVIWMCDNDKKLQRRTMTWRKVARGNLPFSPTLTHTHRQKKQLQQAHTECISFSSWCRWLRITFRRPSTRACSTWSPRWPREVGCQMWSKR